MGSCFEIFGPQKDWIQLREKYKQKDKHDFVSSFFWTIFERKWVYFDLELYLTETERLEFSWKWLS